MRKFNSYTEIGQNIDFSKLANGKKALLIEIKKLESNIESLPNLTGQESEVRSRLQKRLDGLNSILELVDSIQDVAVDVYGKKDSEIFPILDIVRLVDGAKKAVN